MISDLFDLVAINLWPTISENWDLVSDFFYQIQIDLGREQDWRLPTLNNCFSPRVDYG